MKIKVLKNGISQRTSPTTGEYVPVGTVIETSESMGAYCIKQGLAELATEDSPKKKVPSRLKANEEDL